MFQKVLERPKIEKGKIPNVEITRPRVDRDLLMLPPSFNRTPVAPDADARSLKQKQF